MEKQVQKRKLTQDEIIVFKYLNELRESGVTNMFGAAPYIVAEFDIRRADAIKILGLWMDNFNEDENVYDTMEVE